MALSFRTKSKVDSRTAWPDFAFLAATSLTFLKPRLKKILRPVAACLSGLGVTANQVTLASLAGSIAIGALLCGYPSHSALFALLPVWLPVRTACAAVDGTLAIEFGQKSRLGGVLNEVCDIVSDAVLLLPLGFIEPFTINTIVCLIALTVLSEIAGIIGLYLGGDRRLEGPLGKADRAIILAILGAAISLFGGLPHAASILIPVLYAGLVLTIWNRVYFAVHEFCERVRSRATLFN